jgi:hypothetical protein
MGSYVPDDAVAEWLTRRNPTALAAINDLPALVADAERDVDLHVGGTPDPVTGRCLTPEALTAAQAQAVSRATCLAAEWRALSDREGLVGADDYLSEGVTRIPGALRPPPPGVAEALSGFGLVRRTLMAEEAPDAAA